MRCAATGCASSRISICLPSSCRRRCGSARVCDGSTRLPRRPGEECRSPRWRIPNGSLNSSAGGRASTPFSSPLRSGPSWKESSVSARKRLARPRLLPGARRRTERGRIAPQLPPGREAARRLIGGEQREGHRSFQDGPQGVSSYPADLPGPKTERKRLVTRCGNDAPWKAWKTQKASFPLFPPRLEIRQKAPDSHISTATTAAVFPHPKNRKETTTGYILRLQDDTPKVTFLDCLTGLQGILGEAADEAGLTLISLKSPVPAPRVADDLRL